MIDVTAVEDRDRPTVRVTTVDATETERVYEVQLGPSEVNGVPVQQGKCVKPDGESRVPEPVFDAARTCFEADGHEVFGE